MDIISLVAFTMPGLREIVIAIFVLVILAVALNLLLGLPQIKPFANVIYLLAVLGVVWWLLTFFGII